MKTKTTSTSTYDERNLTSRVTVLLRRLSFSGSDRVAKADDGDDLHGKLLMN